MLREFIENLSDLNDGENFPVDTLKSIYQSIQNQPLQFALYVPGPVPAGTGSLSLFIFYL